MLQSLDWETLESRRFNMRLCIIYKAYYNLAIFPLSDYATPITVQTRGNNIKFILPHEQRYSTQESIISMKKLSHRLSKTATFDLL